jgi:hypothetical protein
MTTRKLEVRVRSGSATDPDRPQLVVRTDWDPAAAAAVICDMWDAHHCVSAARRVTAMAPRVNVVATALRAQGTLIIHAPSDCMDYYRGTPQRRQAMEAPTSGAPVPIDWNDWDQESDVRLPASLTDPGPCSCGTGPRCPPAEPAYPWTRQTPLIDIATGRVLGIASISIGGGRGQNVNFAIAAADVRKAFPELLPPL